MEVRGASIAHRPGHAVSHDPSADVSYFLKCV